MENNEKKRSKDGRVGNQHRGVITNISKRHRYQQTEEKDTIFKIGSFVSLFVFKGQGHAQ